MMHLTLLNVGMLLLGGTYTVAVDVKKAPTESSRPTTRAATHLWTNVTLIPGEGDPISQLFAECLKPSRRREYKPSIVESPSTGFIYWRYELNQGINNSGPSTWAKVLDTDDIFGCADAAADYRLFRFEDKKCSLSNMTFSEESFSLFQYGRPEGAKEVIFINFAIPPSSCVGHGVLIDGNCVNIVQFEAPLQQDVSWSWYSSSICNTMYSSDMYTAKGGLPMPALQNYLRTNKFTGEFRVGARLNKEFPRVEWNPSLWNNNPDPVDLAFVETSSYADYENTGGVVISSTHDYKLVVKDYDSQLSGVICMT